MPKKLYSAISIVVLLALVVIASVTYVSQSGSKNKAQTNLGLVPEDLKQLVIIDLSQFCFNLEAGGGATSTLNSLEQVTAKVDAKDLNIDGEDELIIFPETVCGSSPRGASGNGPIYIYGKANGAWRSIGALDGNGYEITTNQSQAYYDIETSWHMSAYSRTKTIYRWDSAKNTYVSVSSTEVTAD